MPAVRTSQRLFEVSCNEPDRAALVVVLAEGVELGLQRGQSARSGSLGEPSLEGLSWVGHAARCQRLGTGLRRRERRFDLDVDEVALA